MDKKESIKKKFSTEKSKVRRTRKCELLGPLGRSRRPGRSLNYSALGARKGKRGERKYTEYQKRKLQKYRKGLAGQKAKEVGKKEGEAEKWAVRSLALILTKIAGGGVWGMQRPHSPS